ncbi:MAG: hypothetical protein ACKV2T_17690, partial [Kofleriaceae bacterium]
MGSVYARWKTLWLKYRDETGKAVSRSSGYKLGQEAEARGLLAELERRVAEAVVPPVVTGARASAAVDQPPLLVRAAGLMVQEYAERWIKGREGRVESVGDEHGRLKNHVYPRIGHLLMRDVRPRHIRDFILDLSTAKVRRRGTGKGEGTSKIAPRTVRHVYATLHRMFRSAVIDEEIETNPVVVEKGVLPKNVDKDPSWRASAVFDRPELISLVSDPRIPEVRRVLNALKGLAALRHGEAAGLRWSDYDITRTPLGKFVVARSYEKERTKTQVSREVPVHPVLAAILGSWRDRGWSRTFGRDPAADDLIVPGRDRKVWEAHDADDFFKEDLGTLGLRNRRGLDLRRTFITLAQVDGARRDLLKVMTHGPAAADIVSMYTSFPWASLCDEVSKLGITLPSTVIEVVEEKIETNPGRPVACETATGESYRSIDFPSALEPLARFERATYGLRNS